jgi:hypothetical protein
MATCPQCGGFLGEDHRCVGLWRLRLRVWGTILLGGMVGGLVGVLVGGGQASWSALAIAVLLGMVIVVAMRRGEPPATHR